MTQSDASPRTVRLLTAILLVATFAAGIATGAGVYYWLVGHAGPPPPPMLGPIPVEELGLSAEQRQRVHEIMERHRPELEAVLQETYPRVRAINERVQEEIQSVLTAEQRTRLDEIRARRGRRPPPGPRGPGPHHPGPPPPEGWRHHAPPPGSSSAGWPLPRPFPPRGPGPAGPSPTHAEPAASVPNSSP